MLTLATFLLAAPPKPDFASLYKGLEKATRANDARSMKAWYVQNAAPSYQYRSRDGVTFNRSAFLKGIDDQARTIQKVVDFKMKIKGPNTTAKGLQVEVRTDFAGITQFDGVKMRLTDKSTVSDTWQSVGGKWKLVSSRQTSADTQMQAAQ